MPLLLRVLSPINKKSTALAEASTTDYPFGKHLWRITNETCYGKEREVEERFVKIW